MKIQKFEDLEIWKLARELYKFVFEITSEGPFSQDFRLRDQIRASSGSISDNIAEGFERGGNKEFIQYLYVSKGSCGETRNQSYRAYDSRYISENVLNELLFKTSEINKHISNFIKYLKTSTFKGEKFKNL